ncbi:transposase [Amycolatopsis azurea]|uniref:transposase n=1 Tax=Amycolatopsis azurea TaxID=36819 RepID=UPI0037F7A627
MQYDLLANHLEARFGDIYEYNLNGGVAGYDIQRWTVDLQQAVRNYLSHDLPDNVLPWIESLSAIGSDGIRSAWVNKLMDSYEPWELSWLVRRAAVAAIPKLEGLLGETQEWPPVSDSDIRTDAAIWLDVHAAHDQFTELACFVGLPNFTAATPGRYLLPEGFDIVRQVTPGELLVAWHSVVGPAPTDLTDDEWNTIVPHLGLRRSSSGNPWKGELVAKRRNFDGIRFKMAQGIPWSQVPSRYGNARVLYLSYRNYLHIGLFDRLADALHNKEGAKNVTEWLDKIGK